MITYNGTPPAPKKIDTTADPVCGQKNPNLTTDDTIVKDGKLANIFIYIKEGTVEGGKKIGDYGWPTPTAAVKLDQNGCHYAPHVLGIQVNQKLSITNSDATQHNIHPTPKLNPEWNQTQSNGAAPIEKTFARAEVADPGQMQSASVDESLHRRVEAPALRSQRCKTALTQSRMFRQANTPSLPGEKVATPEEKTMEVTVTANGTAKADFAFPKAQRYQFNQAFVADDAGNRISDAGQTLRTI